MYPLGLWYWQFVGKGEFGKCRDRKVCFFCILPKTEGCYMAARPGWAEQDPQNWWENLKLSTQAVMARRGLVRWNCRYRYLFIRCTDWFVRDKGKCIDVRLLWCDSRGGSIQTQKAFEALGGTYVFICWTLREFYRFQTGAWIKENDLLCTNVFIK